MALTKAMPTAVMAAAMVVLTFSFRSLDQNHMQVSQQSPKPDPQLWKLEWQWHWRHRKKQEEESTSSKLTLHAPRDIIEVKDSHLHKVQMHQMNFKSIGVSCWFHRRALFSPT
jgi:hypothetical protein